MESFITTGVLLNQVIKLSKSFVINKLYVAAHSEKNNQAPKVKAATFLISSSFTDYMLAR